MCKQTALYCQLYPCFSRSASPSTVLPATPCKANHRDLQIVQLKGREYVSLHAMQVCSCLHELLWSAPRISLSQKPICTAPEAHMYCPRVQATGENSHSIDQQPLGLGAKDQNCLSTDFIMYLC